MTVDPVVSRAIYLLSSPRTPDSFNAIFIAPTSAFIWSACDCVAKSGSVFDRWIGYSTTPLPIVPFLLSTIETLTLAVPKSTPATIGIVPRYVKGGRRERRRSRIADDVSAILLRLRSLRPLVFHPTQKRQTWRSTSHPKYFVDPSWTASATCEKVPAT